MTALENRMILNLIYVSLALVYGVILFKEDDSRLTKFFAITLIVISFLALSAVIAMEMN